MSANGIRHFLDLADIPKGELRAMIDASRAMKAKRDARRPSFRSRARRWR